MVFTYITVELSVFIFAMLLYTKLRRQTIFPIAFVRNLTVYLPPQPEDFEVLNKSSQLPRENKHGKVNKHDKQKVSKQTKLPLRSMDLNEQMLKYCQEYFPEYDFFFMVFHITLLMFLFSMTFKVFYPEYMETNLVFYLSVFTLLVVLANLMKDTFLLGYFKYTDETKMQFLLGLKSFIVVWSCFAYLNADSLFDFKIQESHAEMVERLNKISQIFGGQFELQVEFTYSILALLAAIMSFAIMKVNVNFAFYFFILTKTQAKSSESFMNVQSSDKRFSFKTLIRLMYFNFLMPIFVCILFVSELAKNLLVPTYFAEEVWQLLRLCFLMIVVGIRMQTFREELQFQFDQSYYLIQKLLVDKNEKLFTYITRRIASNFLQTWYFCFQQLTVIIVPMYLIMCLMHRMVSFSFTSLTTFDFDFTSTYELMVEAQNSGEGPYKLIEDNDQLQKVISEISAKGFLPLSYQQSVFNFLLFWYFFMCFFIQSFALLYYRKFRDS